LSLLGFRGGINLRTKPQRARPGRIFRALKLQANYAPLFKCVEAAFAKADERGKPAFHVESEFAHDRHERRRASVIGRPKNAPDFPDLAAVGRIEAERPVGNGKLVKTVHSSSCPDV
jgi:hypothetical protein